MDLLDWQSRLREHFDGLRHSRSVAAPGRAIFGLEHGLDDREITVLFQAIREHVAGRPPSSAHSLPWVVYASEYGYRYAGDEYWQTFENETPSWDRNRDRPWLRQCFRSFHERHGGAEPTGAWAGQFSIICWPIAHAILPCDLQRQLARLLFDLRYSLSAEVMASPRRLGELVAARSWDTSSRFQKLTEEPLFLGQIATALLLRGDELSSALIHPQTLARISADLDRERLARTWLRGARENARRRLQFQAIHGQGMKGASSEGDSDGGVGRTAGGVALEPLLILRPQAACGWEVRVELPDLSVLPVRAPNLADALLSRCRVPASSARPRARGYLLHGPQTVTLQRWPRQGEPLIEFDQAPLDLEQLLGTECLIGPGPIWLFKVNADGLARELRTSSVRPGQKYVILFEERRGVRDHPSLIRVNLSCKDVHAVEVAVPPTVTSDLSDVLNEIGLRLSETVHVWPSGLTPARWNGEGAAEWLSTDAPVVGLRADHDVDSFVLALGSDKLAVVPAQAGEPVFVRLPALQPGLHKLGVTALDQADASSGASGVLEIKIREPLSWTPGSSGTGFLVVVEPHRPTFEQLWESKVEIAVQGPRTRRVRCIVEMYKQGDAAPCLRKQLPSLRLPVKDVIWQTLFGQHLRDSREAQNNYDLAHSCQLHLHAEDLGRVTLTFEREFSPLRWAVRRTRSEFFLRALDDSGDETGARVSHYSFENPDSERQLDPSRFLRPSGERVADGLYVARTTGELRTVVIPREVRTLADLRLSPRLTVRRRTLADLRSLLGVLELWARARLTGSGLSFFIRREVLLVLLREVFHVIAGDGWDEVEQAARKGAGVRDLARVAARALARKPDELNLLTMLAEEAGDLATKAPGERVERFCLLLDRYLHIGTVIARTGLLPDERNHRLLWVGEFALRLACCANGTNEWAGDKFSSAVSSLLDSPSLARAARFLVFAIACERGASLGSDLYGGWAWT